MLFLHDAVGDFVEHFHFVGFVHLDGKVETDDAAAFGEDLSQVVEVGNEVDDSAALDQGFHDGDSDTETVSGTSASAELVDYD